jgi:phospholipid/cholesterol/gamma-HCH transport system ATP-binding protein
LQDAAFKIEKGESVVIIGRSGSGKSVLLKHLIGLMKPDFGTGAREWRRYCGDE